MPLSSEPFLISPLDCFPVTQTDMGFFQRPLAQSYLTLPGSGKLCKAHGLPSFLGSAALLLIKCLSWVLANSQQVATTSRRIFSSDYPLRTFCRQLEEEEAPTDIFRGLHLTRMGD